MGNVAGQSQVKEQGGFNTNDILTSVLSRMGQVSKSMNHMSTLMDVLGERLKRVSELAGRTAFAFATVSGLPRVLKGGLLYALSGIQQRGQASARWAGGTGNGYVGYPSGGGPGGSGGGGRGRGPRYDPIARHKELRRLEIKARHEDEAYWNKIHKKRLQDIRDEAAERKRLSEERSEAFNARKLQHIIQQNALYKALAKEGGADPATVKSILEGKLKQDASPATEKLSPETAQAVAEKDAEESISNKAAASQLTPTSVNLPRGKLLVLDIETLKKVSDEGKPHRDPGLRKPDTSQDDIAEISMSVVEATAQGVEPVGDFLNAYVQHEPGKHYLPFKGELGKNPELISPHLGELYQTGEDKDFVTGPIDPEVADRDDSPEVWSPKDIMVGLAEMLRAHPDATIVGHNIRGDGEGRKGFDIPLLLEQLRKGLDENLFGDLSDHEKGLFSEAHERLKSSLQGSGAFDTQHDLVQQYYAFLKNTGQGEHIATKKNKDGVTIEDTSFQGLARTALRNKDYIESHSASGEVEDTVLVLQAILQQMQEYGVTPGSYGSVETEGALEDAASATTDAAEKLEKAADRLEEAANKLLGVAEKPDPSAVDPKKITYNGGKTPAGWKLHLGVEGGAEGENAKNIEEYLKQNNIAHKRGQSNEQDGKDLTVYVGAKDDADKMAEDLKKKFGDVLLNPETSGTGQDVLFNDVPFNDKVWGRYDIQPYDKDFGQYGAKGFPLLKDDEQDVYNNPELRPAMEERAQKALQHRYGEHYTGSAKVDTPPASRTLADYEEDYRKASEEYDTIQAKSPVSLTEGEVLHFGDGSKEEEEAFQKVLEASRKREEAYRAVGMHGQVLEEGTDLSKIAVPDLENGVPLIEPPELLVGPEAPRPDDGKEYGLALTPEPTLEVPQPLSDEEIERGLNKQLKVRPWETFAGPQRDANPDEEVGLTTGTPEEIARWQVGPYRPNPDSDDYAITAEPPGPDDPEDLKIDYPRLTEDDIVHDGDSEFDLRLPETDEEWQELSRQVKQNELDRKKAEDAKWVKPELSEEEWFEDYKENYDRSKLIEKHADQFSQEGGISQDELAYLKEHEGAPSPQQEGTPFADLSQEDPVSAAISHLTAHRDALHFARHQQSVDEDARVQTQQDIIREGLDYQKIAAHADQFADQGAISETELLDLPDVPAQGKVYPGELGNLGAAPYHRRTGPLEGLLAAKDEAQAVSQAAAEVATGGGGEGSPPADGAPPGVGEPGGDEDADKLEREEVLRRREEEREGAGKVEDYEEARRERLAHRIESLGDLMSPDEVSARASSDAFSQHLLKEKLEAPGKEEKETDEEYQARVAGWRGQTLRKEVSAGRFSRYQAPERKIRNVDGKIVDQFDEIPDEVVDRLVDTHTDPAFEAYSQGQALDPNRYSDPATRRTQVRDMVRRGFIQPPEPGQEISRPGHIAGLRRQVLGFGGDDAQQKLTGDQGSYSTIGATKVGQVLGNLGKSFTLLGKETLKNVKYLTLLGKGLDRFEHLVRHGFSKDHDPSKPVPPVANRFAGMLGGIERRMGKIDQFYRMGLKSVKMRDPETGEKTNFWKYGQKKAKEQWENLPKNFAIGATVAGNMLRTGSPDMFDTVVESFKLIVADLSRILIPTAVMVAQSFQQVSGVLSGPWATGIMNALAPVIKWGTILAGGAVAINLMLSGLTLLQGAFAGLVTSLSTFKGGLMLAGAAVALALTKLSEWVNSRVKDSEKRQKAAEDEALYAHNKKRDVSHRDSEELSSTSSTVQVREDEKKYMDKYLEMYKKDETVGFDKHRADVGTKIDEVDKQLQEAYKSHDEIVAYNQSGFGIGNKARQDKAADRVQELARKKSELVSELGGIEAANRYTSKSRRGGKAEVQVIDKLKNDSPEWGSKEHLEKQSQGLSSMMAALRTVRAQPQYSSIEDAYKRVQLESLGKDDLERAFEEKQLRLFEMMLEEMKNNGTITSQMVEVMKGNMPQIRPGAAR